MKILASLALIILPLPVISAKNGRDKKMVSVESVIKALSHEDATVDAVARLIGTPEGRRSGGFDVKPADQHFRRVLIGVDANQDEHSAPDYVDFRSSEDQPFTLSELLPKCNDWKVLPANPISSQYVYGCHAVVSLDEVSISMIVTLSGDKGDPSSVIEALLLQRNTK